MPLAKVYNIVMNIKFYNQRKKELGLTYDDIAEKTGLNRKTIINLFTGRMNNPTTLTVNKIEQALGIGRADEEVSRDILPTIVRNIDPDEDELLELYRELGERKGSAIQKNIVQLLHHMLDNK